MEINLKNKTAWVFGGSKGIGRAIAIQLSRSGANILLVSRNKTDLIKTKDELCVKHNQDHDFISVDMSNIVLLTKTIKNYINLNSVDIVVNNSGGPAGGPAHTAEADEYLSAFNQHVLSAQIINQIVLPIMKRKQFGRIINIISTSVKQPIEGLGVSNTVRGAMASWSKTLSVELGQFGITVNNILPGATKTDRLIQLIQSKANKNGVSSELVAETMRKNIPIGRFAEPNEIAYTVVFLCSGFASYINGVNIPIDGGRTKSL
ncbi:MAG: short-chain dehydrogenase [Flavobacteriales bacterium]|nr:short-chain dehydrogenase [Flavobacteriales bacterium]|tara:strand:+ start:40242 stop:41027 length:786 start_codon:yes stop_codon:yes gene_type:complete